VFTERAELMSAQSGCPDFEYSCADGLRNGQETGLDCGGPDCGVCPCDALTLSQATGDAAAEVLPFQGDFVVGSELFNGRRVYQHASGIYVLYYSLSYVQGAGAWVISGGSTAGADSGAVAFASTPRRVPETVGLGAWQVRSGSSFAAHADLQLRCWECGHVQQLGADANCADVYYSGVRFNDQPVYFNAKPASGASRALWSMNGNHGW
jgi:hypothetical protein